MHNIKNRSKADFKSKLQNIWQQIILFSRTVMQMICAWPKIWTLLGRISLMRTVQLMKTMSDASKNIFRVYHIRIIAPKKWFTRHETDRFLNNHCQECVRAYLSIHDCLSFRNKATESKSVSTTMARSKNMHTDLQISNCWEHISTWTVHE